jgi:hypothetical protein
VICDNALINGFAINRRPADREVVLEVCRDLDFGRSGEPTVPRRPTTTPGSPSPLGVRPAAHPPAIVPEGSLDGRSKPRSLAVAGGQMFKAFTRRGFSFFQDDV